MKHTTRISIAIVVGILGCAVCSPMLHAQQRRTPSTPRRQPSRTTQRTAPAPAPAAPVPNSAVPAPYRAPRTSDGRPDLNGIWQALDGPNWNLEPHAADFGTVPQLGAINAVPPGVGFVDGPIPYKPEMLAQRNENYKNRMMLDPEAKCYLPGVPRAMYMSQPFQIIQSPDYIMIVFQYAGAVRTIYMKDPKEAPAPSWMGWSNGHWEGDMLVIETTGLDDRTWFDRAGNFHSDELKVVERIQARSAESLTYEATIEDPKTFTRSWKISVPLYRHVEKNAQLLEFKCVEFAEEMLYGHLRKQPVTKEP